MLRRRSALPVEEIWRLLDGLPALLDEAERQGDSPAAQLLLTVRVVFENDAQKDCASRSVSEWPPFHLDLIADAAQGKRTGMPDSPRANPPARFAALLHEMLGGPHRADGARPPLAALDEAANRTLQRALAGGGFGSCAEFWREFLRESGSPQRGMCIASRLPGSGTPGQVLRLIPRDASMPIRLCARARFCIGRSLAEADLPTRFHPKTPDNETRTHQIGRVHVCGEIIDGQPTLRDGNGTAASENGSTLDEWPLAHDRATPILQSGVLTLAGHFALAVVPHLAPMDDFAIETLPTIAGGRAPELRGAIIFARCDGEPLLRESVWLFTRVDFTLGQDDRVIWLPPGKGNHAAFLRIGGCFWLVNANLGGETASLGVGEAAPLTAGQTLRLGAREYSVEIE